MSIIKLILFSLLFNLFISEDSTKDPPDIFDKLKCGEEDSPEDEEDCTKYGTGSGMVCCYISTRDKKNARCRLVPNNIAREQNIRGIQTFTKAGVDEDKRYWNCGNSSNYIYIQLLNILLLMILLWKKIIKFPNK